MMISKSYCTYPMSIANSGIMLTSVYEGQKSTETTRFVLVSYHDLDTFHTQPDVSTAHGYDHETRLVLGYKCRVIS
jgi:hypothetical protein